LNSCSTAEQDDLTKVIAIATVNRKKQPKLKFSATFGYMV